MQMSVNIGPMKLNVMCSSMTDCFLFQNVPPAGGVLAAVRAVIALMATVIVCLGVSVTMAGQEPIVIKV